MGYFFLVFVVLVIIQWYLKMSQAKKFHKHYYEFIKKGNVLVERKKGILSGAIIMFQLDEKANIHNCLILEGSSFFASQYRCEGLINRNLLELKEEHLDKYEKTVRHVIDKAISTYHNSITKKLA